MSNRIDTAAQSERGTLGDAGKALLTAGGLAAAFGAASCCALPVLLGSIGLGSVWIGALALVAGPYQPVLIALAVLCVAGGALIGWRQQRAACAVGSSSSRTVVNRLAQIGMCITALLVVLALTMA
jgi:mercuric ion transport protein